MLTLYHYNGKESLSVSLTIMHAPIRQRKVGNFYVPYIDMDLKHKMFLRDFYKKLFNKARNPEDWKLFQNFRNITNVENLTLFHYSLT